MQEGDDLPVCQIDGPSDCPVMSLHYMLSAPTCGGVQRIGPVIIHRSIQGCLIRPYHHVFASEDDPEREEDRVEESLPDVAEQHHVGHVDPECKPLNRHCQHMQSSIYLNIFAFNIVKIDK